MSQWLDHILKEFPEDVARLWIAADPDDVLLDEQVLARLRERGFELLTFEDSVTFRAEYENRYRCAWDDGKAGPAKALILACRWFWRNMLPMYSVIRRCSKVCQLLNCFHPRAFCFGWFRRLGIGIDRVWASTERELEKSRPLCILAR